MLLRRLALLALMLLLGGCGFHLRGALPLPEVLAKTHIVAPRGSAMRYELESLLAGAGSEVVTEGASAVLTIHADNLRSRVLSVDTLGHAREYALTLMVKYSLRAADGKELTAQLSSRVERDLRVNPDNVLARSAEQEMVEREMRQLAARQILQRLQSLSIEPATGSVSESAPAQ